MVTRRMRGSQGAPALWAFLEFGLPHGFQLGRQGSDAWSMHIAQFKLQLCKIFTCRMWGSKGRLIMSSKHRLHGSVFPAASKRPLSQQDLMGLHYQASPCASRQGVKLSPAACGAPRCGCSLGLWFGVRWWHAYSQTGLRRIVSADLPKMVLCCMWGSQVAKESAQHGVKGA